MRLIAGLLEQSASVIIQDSSPVSLGLPGIGSEPHVAPLEQQDTLGASDCKNTGTQSATEWGNQGSHEGRKQLEAACTEEQLSWYTITPSLLWRFSLRKWEPLLEMGWTALLEKVWWWPAALSWEQTGGSHRLGKSEAVPLLTEASRAWELPCACVWQMALLRQLVKTNRNSLGKVGSKLNGWKLPSESCVHQTMHLLQYYKLLRHLKSH